MLVESTIAKSNNINELWYDTLNRITSCGHRLTSRVGACTEILGYQAVLTNPFNNLLFVPSRKLSLAYASAEILWYLSGSQHIRMISAYAPQYEKFAEKGIAYGAYGFRWSHNPGFKIESERLNHDLQFRNQLEAVVELLRADPNTRQAVITMWDSGDLLHAIEKDHKDLPCTISLNFFVREKKLHLIATMRSNDSWLGFPYDVFCFTYLQRIVAAMLQLDLGTYIHQAGSEHIYSTNAEKIHNILIHPCDDYPYPHPVGWPTKSVKEGRITFDDIKTALKAEENFRFRFRMTTYDHRDALDILNDLYQETSNLHPIFRDLVLGAATKWAPTLPKEQFNNPLFSTYQRLRFPEN